MSDVSGAEYKGLFKIAFIATIAMLVIIPLQILVFSITTMPVSVFDWIDLFRIQPLIGMFHADFFILVNNVLIAVIYLAFYHTLKDVNKGVLQVGIVLGLVGIAAYISSNKTFELWTIANEHFAAADPAERAMLEAAGKASLLGWQGTAFDAYYVLNGITLFIVSILMYRSPLYTKGIASWGLAAAIFMLIPSTAGIVGLVCSLLSLIPWYVFAVRFAVVFRRLAR